MTISDAIVIYLTCGSPFAVHVLMTDEEFGAPQRALYAAMNFAAWPAVAAQFLYRLVRGERAMLFDGPSHDRERMDTLIQEMVNSANFPGSGTSVFESRDILERYTGLAAAFFQSLQAGETFELFEVSGHPEPGLALTCLSRRTRDKLEMHLTSARKEFVDLTADLVRTSASPSAIAKVALKIADAAKDQAAAEELRSIQLSPAVSRQRGVSADGNDQLWSTEQASTLAN